MNDKEKIHNMASCMLSILDTIKLHDWNSLHEEDETLSQMVFRKMEAYEIDLNKELDFTHLKPVTKEEQKIRLRENHFNNDNKLYKEDHRDECLILQRILIEKGFKSCGLGDAESLWMEYSERSSARFLGMSDDDNEIYDCIKDQLYSDTRINLS